MASRPLLSQSLSRSLRANRIYPSIPLISSNSILGTRNYVVPADPEKEPQRKPSNTPIYLILTAAAVVTGYYTISNKNPPSTPATDAIERAMSPKTRGANIEGEDPSTGYSKRH